MKARSGKGTLGRGLRRACASGPRGFHPGLAQMLAWSPRQRQKTKRKKGSEDERKAPSFPNPSLSSCD
ncbi:hypothetical protein AKJ64_00210 [candidate division MSBL1 archaeon SCGC-AAA259E17]|uniref:Uncharacterized protein n=1 Tax=candidate division MSBL1 archaeon SCGC-AAA259E17 TaxID=1698263 RepID=A0A133UHD5_9EURY|nr:hypothetical protein AKJ64_00210 [candidate division MSBL1 archaeon SCGC-AAA259E17]